MSFNLVLQTFFMQPQKKKKSKGERSADLAVSISKQLAKSTVLEEFDFEECV